MKTYIELWKAKDTWKNLSKEERASYLDQLAPAINQLIAGGVEIIAWGENERATFARAEYDYFAVWKFPKAEAVASFENLVEAVGWYSYFDQVNANGNTTTPQDVMSKMISL